MPDTDKVDCEADPVHVLAVPNSKMASRPIARDVASLMSVLDIAKLKHAIKLCRSDIARHYIDRGEVEEALGRIGKLEAVILVSQNSDQGRGRYLR